MIKLLKYIIYSLFCLIICSCSNKQNIKHADNNKENFDFPQTDAENSNPFYPLKESIHELQNEILDLKGKIIEYESRLHTPMVDIELLKLFKSPNITTEIIMNNGTKIQGSIVSEDSNQMIVQTQIGQLTIEKEFVQEIKEIEPLQANVIFDEESIEERVVNDSTYQYIGKVKNEGGRRADFARVIYHFWADDTNLVFSDSSFVNGNSIVYLNGVISDSSIEPAEFGNFKINVSFPDSLNIQYSTREIKWNLFE